MLYLKIWSIWTIYLSSKCENNLTAAEYGYLLFLLLKVQYEACPKSKVSINIKNRKSALLKKFLHGHIILLINYFST